MSDREAAQEALRQHPSHVEEPRVLLVGVGGAGIRLLRAVDGELGIERVALDTDDYSLALSRVERQVHLAPREGDGTGGDPTRGREAALRHRDEIHDLLQADILLLTAGLGRGTGTGAAPIVAQLAKEKGLAVLAFVTWPFRAEEIDESARGGLAELQATCDGLLVLDNQATLSFPGIEAKREAADLVNEMMRRVLRDLQERVQGAFPFSVHEEMADFLETLPASNQELPVRAAQWGPPPVASAPLTVDPRGVVKLR